MTPFLEVSELGFSIGQKTLLDSVDFQLPAGEILAVCGPNGAGKSTLLKCLAGQLKPSRGNIQVGGIPLETYPPNNIAQWRGVLPQSGAIPFEFSAEEIVLLGRSPHSQGFFTKRDHAIAHESMEQTDTTHLATRSISTLSGGELQRVHLARVLSQIWDPVEKPGRLLLLDEPTSALDLRHQHELLAKARAWAKQGTAVLVILHDLNLASHYADRILLLHQTRPAALGPPTEVLQSQILKKVFDVHTLVIPHPATGRPLVTVDPTLTV